MPPPAQEQLANYQLSAAILWTLVLDVPKSVLVILAYAFARGSDGWPARATVYHPARLRTSLILSKSPRE
jgi:hypothetical protein